MTFTINADDARTIRALELAAEAGQWLVCRTRDGRQAFGLGSEQTPGRYYLVTPTSCDCADFRRARASSGRRDQGTQHACKHMLAVRLHCELVKAQQHETSRPSGAGGRGGHLRLVPSPTSGSSRNAG